MSDFCLFCDQEIADGEDFCPSACCRQGWLALFGPKPEHAPPDDDGELVLPLAP